MRLAAGDAGLERDSLALCHQPTTLDRSTFSDRIGTLTEDRMAEIDAGLAAALDLSPVGG